MTVDTGGVSFDAEQTIVLTLTGSATAADDYTITPASITIAAGQTAGSATITTVDDAESEGDETITITASHEAASIGTRNPDHHRQRRGLQPDRHPGQPSPRATTPS